VTYQKTVVFIVTTVREPKIVRMWLYDSVWSDEALLKPHFLWEGNNSI